MKNLEKLLAENMRRFNTKNLLSEDTDQNNNGFPDSTEVSDPRRRPSIWPGRGPSIQINGPYPEKFFLNDDIAILKNSKKEVAHVYKHPNDNDYYVIVRIPYNKRSMTSSYYDFEADTVDEIKLELIQNEFMLPTENIEQFVIEGNII
jgi:hypothetical protein